MAEDKDSSAEKSQEPTPKRLDKAREDGDMARSRELNTLAILLAGSGAMIAFGPYMGDVMGQVMRQNLVLEREHIFDTATMFTNLNSSVMAGLRSLLPLFGVLLVAAILGPIALSGWNLAIKAIVPKASRMNPASGLKRMFGKRAVMELGKALAKVLTVAAIAAVIFNLNKERILNIHTEPTQAAIIHTLSIVAWSVLAMSCAMILIAMVDIPFQIHQHREKLKMTYQQVKDEHKESDGSPEVKQKIRQLQYQMSQNRQLGDVPDADVVITNPEHYSVALRYRQDSSGAPVMLASGVDFMALRIREIAREHDIPLVESPALARAIHFNTKAGDEIPAGLYMAVAQVLAYIYQLEEYQAGRARAPELATDLPIPDELRRDT